MIICPNSGNECTENLITPLSKTAFLSIAYPDEKEIEIKEKIDEVQKNILAVFKGKKYNVILARDRKGKNLYCKICQQIQSTPIGIIVLTKETPYKSYANLFLELGIMSSFGKELILLKDCKVKIPADLHGLEWTQFEDFNDLNKQLSEQIEQFKKTSDYYDNWGNFYKEKGDLEKTIDYYKRAYLLNPKGKTLKKLQNLLIEVSRKSKEQRYSALSIRLKDSLKFFLECMKT